MDQIKFKFFYFLSAYLLLSLSPMLLTCWPLTWASWWRISGLMIPKIPKNTSIPWSTVLFMDQSPLYKTQFWAKTGTFAETYATAEEAPLFLYKRPQCSWVPAGKSSCRCSWSTRKDASQLFQAISLEVWETYGMILCPSSHNHFGGCNRKYPIGRIQFPLNGTTAGWGRVNDVWLWPSIPGYLL